MNELIDFKWIDKDGKSHKPQEMTTHHLFFTLRMIWNHTAPAHLRFNPYKKYNTSVLLSNKEYVRTAIVSISAELFGRDDLTDYMKECLLKIQSYFNLKISGEDHGKRSTVIRR